MNINVKKNLLPIFGVALIFGILLSYPISIASGAMIFLAQEFTMTSLEKSNLVCLVLLGAIVGILGGGSIADRYGRKKTLFFAASFLFVGSLFSVMVKAFPELLFFRFLVGIGIGISSMVVPVYLAEMSLPRYRGKMVSLFQVAITLGILISYLVNLCFLQSQSWRGSLGISAVFALLGLILVFVIPESPSWLVAKGDVEGGRELLMRFYPHKEAEEIIHKVIESKKNLKQITFRKLFQGGLKKALMIGVLLSMFQQITGINTIICYAPEIFHHAGITDLCSKLIATALLGALNVATAVFTMTQIDKWGRRKLLLMGIPGMIVALLFLYQGLFAVASLVAYLIFFGISLGPVVWVITAEIFPLEIRGKAVSVALFVNWATSLIISAAFLFLADAIGMNGVFLLFALMSLLAFLFVYFFVPETKEKTLEEIQEYWKK